MRLDLIFSTRDIYINFNLKPFTKVTSRSRSTKLSPMEAPRYPPWNISQMIAKAIPISTRIVISYVINRAFCCEFDGKSM